MHPLARLASVLFLMVCAVGLPAAESYRLPTADRVIVYKGLREMRLYQGRALVRTYHVSLGQQPQGAKERSGDLRTPEGIYRLDQRNPRSEYFLSIRVSYPNDMDRARAQRHGWDAGGAIMIHGLPNDLKFPARYYLDQDWTDGCIALSNADMLEFWLLVQDNIPIEIRA